MSVIDVLEHETLYDNPMPHLRSRHGYFPGVVQLPSGDLLAVVAIGEAFESVDLAANVLRSADLGHTWQLQGPLADRSTDEFPINDAVKPTALSNGTVVAMGYRFYRHNLDQALANPETNGLQPGDNVIAFSHDEGRTWSPPQVLPLSRPEILEVSGPCIELRSGELLACGYPFPLWDGASPSGAIGVLLRSRDLGKTFDDRTLYFKTSRPNVAPYEARLCEMQDGRVVIMTWAFDLDEGRSLANHVAVSHDNGTTWSDAIDTGVPGQASNLMWLGGDRLLSIHCQREGDVGLYVRVVDFTGDRWQVLAEQNVWDRAASHQVRGIGNMWESVKFGQASLLRLTNGEILATHWAVEEGQGRILTHRLRVDLDQL